MPFLASSPPLQMPPLFAAEATKERLKKLQPLAPLTIHLRQEIDRWVLRWFFVWWVLG
jgi:hypothetical protein